MRDVCLADWYSHTLLPWLRGDLNMVFAAIHLQAAFIGHGTRA
jgi:hypothetical protein